MSGSDHYILKGKTPVLCPDLLLWAAWFNDADRHVKQDTIQDFWISTVFLGLDHGWGDKLLLFETMVFDKSKIVNDLDGAYQAIDEYSTRYSTWDEAEEGHEKIVKLIRKSMLRVIAND